MGGGKINRVRVNGMGRGGKSNEILDKKNRVRGKKNGVGAEKIG